VKISSSGKKVTRRACAGAFVFFLVACAGPPPHAPDAPAGVSNAPLAPPLTFAFDSLDDRPVSSDSTRGKPTVIAFVTTGSIVAQAQVDFLVAMAKNDGDKVNYAVVALESRENRELVELYRKALSISFPVAVADAETLAGAGVFHDVSVVPVTVLLDRSGRVAWRADGRVARSEEIRVAMRGL
jgi:hypothetical protein